MKYLAKIKLAKLEFFGIRDEKWIEMIRNYGQIELTLPRNSDTSSF